MKHMSPYLDTILVLTAVAAAAGYFVRGAFQRHRRKDIACASGCGCALRRNPLQK
jgi:hypothetical protein